MIRENRTIVVGCGILLMALQGFGQEPEELIENGGFEGIVPYVVNEIHKEVFRDVKEIPKGWTMNVAYPGKLTVIYDAETAHGGSKFIRLEQSMPPGVGFYHLDRKAVLPGEKYSISIWVKGKGQFILRAYSYDDKVSLGTIGDRIVDVASEEWVKYTTSFTISESVKYICPAFHATGIVDIDDTSFTKQQ